MQPRNDSSAVPERPLDEEDYEPRKLRDEGDAADEAWDKRDWK